MTDHPISKLKCEIAEGYTLADQPLEVSATATLKRDDLMEIRSKSKGHAIALSDLIDNYDDFESQLKKYIAFNYSLDDYDKYDLNFLLLDASIGQIHSPTTNLVLAASLGLPHVEGISMPYDSVVDGYRKLIDYSKPLHFAMGQPHAVVHTMNDKTVNKDYNLLNKDSILNPKLMMPNREIMGSGGAMDCVNDNLMLHAYNLNNGTVYDDKNHVGRVEVLSADGQKGTVNSQHLICIPKHVMQNAWYEKMAQYHRDEGKMVPLQEYSRGLYLFLDSWNQSRSSSFNALSTIFNGQIVKDTPIVKMNYTFRIVPIVPKHKSGKEHTPFSNFSKHVRDSIPKVDKAFDVPNITIINE